MKKKYNGENDTMILIMTLVRNIIWIILANIGLYLAFKGVAVEPVPPPIIF